MKTKFFALFCTVLMIAGFGYCAEDETNEGIDLHKVICVAKDEHYKSELKIKVQELRGEATQEMNMRVVLVTTVTDVENETPTGYSVQPIEMEMDAMGQVHTEDLSSEAPMVITRSGDSWECTVDGRNEGAGPHSIAVCQSPMLAQCLFPANPVSEGDTWEINKEQTAKYVEMLVLGELDELNLNSEEWKSACKLAKLTKETATIELDVTAPGIVATDGSTDTVDLSGKITLGIDLEKKMVSTLNGSIELTVKNGDSEEKLAITGEVTISKE